VFFKCSQAGAGGGIAGGAAGKQNISFNFNVLEG
jgi:hypothetical protein